MHVVVLLLALLLREQILHVFLALFPHQLFRLLHILLRLLGKLRLLRLSWYYWWWPVNFHTIFLLLLEFVHDLGLLFVVQALLRFFRHLIVLSFLRLLLTAQGIIIDRICSWLHSWICHIHILGQGSIATNRLGLLKVHLLEVVRHLAKIHCFRLAWEGGHGALLGLGTGVLTELRSDLVELLTFTAISLQLWLDAVDACVWWRAWVSLGALSKGGFVTLAHVVVVKVSEVGLARLALFHRTAWHKIACYRTTIWHSATWHCAAWHCAVWHCAVWHCAAWEGGAKLRLYFRRSEASHHVLLRYVFVLTIVDAL